MPRQKLNRFADNLADPLVLEDTKPIYNKLKGNWNKDFFDQTQPITLELGCGNGEYAVGLASQFPERNFVGVDVKGDRLWVGSKEAKAAGLNNVGFLRAQIQSITDFFTKNEVDTIWVTFPDPRPRDRDIKRRLTGPRFLDMYKSILQPEGQVFFKTDNTGLFEYTLEVLNERNDILDLAYTFNLYESEYMDEHYGIKTRFEKKFYDLGENIKYLKFKFAQ